MGKLVFYYNCYNPLYFACVLPKMYQYRRHKSKKIDTIKMLSELYLDTIHFWKFAFHTFPIQIR